MGLTIAQMSFEKAVKMTLDRVASGDMTKDKAIDLIAEFYCEAYTPKDFLLANKIQGDLTNPF